MKKLLVVIAILVVSTLSFLAGKSYGVKHAMEDAIVSYYNGTVVIELDGQLYEHYAE